MADEFAADRARDAGQKDAVRLWRAWRTVHEMVRDRGYELADEEVDMNFEDFKDKFESTDGTVE